MLEQGDDDEYLVVHWPLASYRLGTTAGFILKAAGGSGGHERWLSSRSTPVQRHESRARASRLAGGSPVVEKTPTPTFDNY